MAETKVLVTSTVAAGVKRFTTQQKAKAAAALLRTALQIETAAKKRLIWRVAKGAPGGRATGRMANSIRHEPARPQWWGDTLDLTVGVGVKYAKYVEGYPRFPRRHFVPFAVAPGLKLWLARHGVEVKEGSKGIMTGGAISGTKFFEPAANEVLPGAVGKIAEALRV